MTETAEIIRIAARGDGVTADGRHVPFASVGDVVTSEGVILPGLRHAAPACPHFGDCGGCQLQHLDDESYKDFVRDRIITGLGAQGIAPPPFAPVHLSPPRTRRRASLKAERRGKKVTIGFNAGSSHRIVDMVDCAILHPALFAMIAPLRRLLSTTLPEKRVANITMTLADQGVDMVIDGIKADTLAAAEGLSDFADAQKIARLSIDDGFGPQTRWEPEPVTITFGGVPVPLPHNSFLQATLDGEAALVAAVLASVGDAGAVADLFCGLGTFALALSTTRKVYAAEAGRDSGMALKMAAGRAQRQVFFEHRDLYRRPLTVAEINRFGAIVLDPPRSGAEEQCRALAESSVPHIAYVSCNPATFARDAKILVEGGYRIEMISPVGQFRWSTHVELAAAFVKQDFQN
ncbi:class I SAM-dependent RNA methyltransferase [Sphingobium boeckii]|uniref:23S rRNA (Uracil1939-C5)-methyltransferase n=1 Tax=Sphingobium boeckii TaxID=1082345 RepID=A0A7W9AKH4_9SPHN|nr:23S rRNA (uracil1939-C5)-methyltransferase [Sphingobium boeckii]